MENNIIYSSGTTVLGAPSAELKFYVESIDENVTLCNSTNVTIGRKKEMCDYAFENVNYISRRHANFIYENGDWYIVDMASVNGTWLNGLKLYPNQKYKLTSGDVIELAHKEKIVFDKQIENVEAPAQPEEIPLDTNAGKRFSILGDSISTLDGFNPKDYNVFYKGDICEKTGVATRKDTWWGQVIDSLGGTLLVNNSWSGSMVTKVNDVDNLFPSACSGERTNGLHIGNVMPDVILVYMGTNDWANGIQLNAIGSSALGGNAYSACYFSLAYKMMLESLKSNYPDAEIWCCTLCETFIPNVPAFVFPQSYGGIHIEEYNDIIESTAVSSGCKVIDLYKYQTPYASVDGSHPTADGMKTLAVLVQREMEEQSDSKFKKMPVIKETAEPEEIETEKEIEAADDTATEEATEAEETAEEESAEEAAVEAVSDEYVDLYPDKAKSPLSEQKILFYDCKAETEISIEDGTFLAGSDLICKLNLKGEGCEKIHAQFYFENGLWYVRDCFSSNGVWMNETRLEPDKKYLLRSNDAIDFANASKFIFFKTEEKIQEPELTVEPTPIVEAEPIIEPTPIVEAEPIIEPIPIVEPAPIAEPIPIAEASPIFEPIKIAEPTPIAEPLPYTDTNRNEFNSDKKFCTSCGAEVDGSFKFCTRCGAKQ